jgi:hypothetical protein
LASPTPSDAPIADTGGTLASYWPFAIMILGLALIGVVVWLRRV